MNPEKQCPECGAAIPAETPEALCPACLLRRGFETRTQDGLSASDLPLPTPESLASRFPQLEIVELLGRGGMGAVYKARHRSLDRWVALKILPAAARRDPAFAERFSREAKALARLDHPNIVAVHDSGEADGLYYFIMEYVDGATLRQILSSVGITPAQALAIVPQICEALQYAHDQGVVHRDIKPENILVDKSGRVKIADFGIAKIVGREASDFTLTAMGEVMGTPAYMAPEQVEHPSAVDHRADIYSLGVVFYQMLTGELPLGRFAPPSRKVHIDVRLDEVVLRTLEKEPDLRYQQAGEVKTEVETIAGTPGSPTNKIQAAPVPAADGWGWNAPVDYRSKTTLWGLPLIHIAQGIDPATGRPRVARGIVAIGGIAQGVIAIGGVAMGGIACGGVAVGGIAFGGLGLGVLTLAGMALGIAAAWGGLAVAPVAMGGSAIGYYARGNWAAGMHIWEAVTKDPAAARFFQGSWPQNLLDYLQVSSLVLGFLIFAISSGAIIWARNRTAPRNPGDSRNQWIQLAVVLVILTAFGINAAFAWNTIQQRRKKEPASASRSHSSWVMFQKSVNDIQPDGAIRVQMTTQKVNLTGTTVLKDRSVSTSCEDPKILDALGHPMAVESKRLKDYYEWWVTLNEPVAPGGIITLVFPENTQTGEIKKVSDFGLYEYSMKHWPAVGGFTRYDALYRLPPGAEVVEKSPASLRQETRDGRVELHYDQMIPAGGFVEIRFRYHLPPSHTATPAAPQPLSPAERFQNALQSAVDRRDKDALLKLFNQEGVSEEDRKSYAAELDQVLSYPGVKVECHQFKTEPLIIERNGKKYTLNGRQLFNVAFYNTDPKLPSPSGPIFQGGMTSKGLKVLMAAEIDKPEANPPKTLPEYEKRVLEIHAASSTAGPKTKEYPLFPPKSGSEAVYLEPEVLLDELNVRSAKVEKGENGYSVRIILDEEGKQRFAEITARRLEKRIGIVVDGKLVSAPMVRDPIFGGNFNFGTDLTEAEANELAATLNRAIGMDLPPASSSPTPVSSASPSPADSASQDDLKNRAAGFVDLLSQGNFAKARAGFDLTMSGAMSEDDLGKLWKQLEANGGKFLGHDAPRQEAFGGYQIVYVPCRWEKVRLDLKVVYNRAGQISGLWIVSPGDSMSGKTPQTP